MGGTVNEQKELLDPVLRRLAELSSAYRNCERTGRSPCDEKLKTLLGRLRDIRVSNYVDQELPESPYIAPLDPERRRRFLQAETDMANRFDYDRKRAQRRIEKALKLVASGPVDDSILRIQTTKELCTFLRSVHDECMPLVTKQPRLWRRGQRRQNKQALARCDAAVYTVGVMITDLLDRAELPLSITVGRITASEAMAR
jgi:hypothetical protein